MSKHTGSARPYYAPWKVERTSTARFMIRGTGVAGEVDIALMKASAVPSEIEARARLVAAAPDLLASLRMLFTQGVDDTADESMRPYFERAKAAIAKAEGTEENP